LQAAIEAKISGHETVIAAEEEQPPVVSLRDALRKSVAKSSPRHRTKPGPLTAKKIRRKSTRRTA
jgi:non-homologous end joining protein Ku